MAKAYLTESQLQVARRRKADLEQWRQEADHAEKCGINCDDLRERAKYLSDFFEAVLREYEGK